MFIFLSFSLPVNVYHVIVYYVYLEAIYTGDVSPKILYTHYRVEYPGKCWLTFHIAIKEMDKRVYITFVF